MIPIFLPIQANVRVSYKGTSITFSGTGIGNKMIKQIRYYFCRDI